MNAHKTLGRASSVVEEGEPCPAGFSPIGIVSSPSSLRSVSSEREGYFYRQTVDTLCTEETEVLVLITEAK